MAEKVACVTGASGFIASWVVKLLLERGYTVRASVRDPANVLKTAHLLALPRAKERLHLFEADLLEEGSFDGALDGCEAVFHTASPCFFTTDNPEDLIEPAVKGTCNVLNACGRAKSIKRVVVTSSMAAVVCSPFRKPEEIVDESFFSDPTYIWENKSWYQLSKTRAELEAWKLAKEHGLDLVTINPGMVIGPLLQPTLNMSSEIVLKLVDGSCSTYKNSAFSWVHVKDVAEAHVLAYEVPGAIGRYLCAESCLYVDKIVEMLRMLYPDLPIAARCADEVSPRVPEYKLCTDKVKGLGLVFTPVKIALKDCVKSLIDGGFLKKVQYPSS